MVAAALVNRAAFADPQTKPLSEFSRGSLAFTTEAAYAHYFNGSPARIESGSVGLGYYFLDNISLNLEAAGFSVQQPGPDSVISGLDLLLRHHLFTSGRFSFYIDVGGGVSYATAPTPYYGTYFNFS